MNWGLMYLHNKKMIGGEDFLKDQFFVYNGLYGIPSHCIWYCAPDKTKEIYQGISFRLWFYNELSGKLVYIEDFIIETSRFNVASQMYEIYATSVIFDDFITSTNLDSKVFTTNRRQPLSGQEIIKRLVESSFPRVRLSFNSNLVDIIKYFGYSFDLDFNALDLLTKICAENKWEWYLRGDGLFISHCLSVNDTNAVIKNPEPYSSKIIHFFNYKFVEMPTDTAQPGSWYGENGRVIWTRYIVGQDIGSMMGLMVENNRVNTLLEGSYLDTLFGIDDKYIIERQMKDYSQNFIIVGKIFGEYKDSNREEYEVPKFSGDVRNFTKWLRTREFKDKFTEKDHPLLYSENVRQTTPYAGDNVGIQYPQDDSHHILFSPYGKREDPLLGPAFYGFNETIPKRNSEKDYRLTLPGATIYIKEDGEIILEQVTATAGVPTGTGVYIKIAADGTITVDTDSSITIGESSTFINLGSGEVIKINADNSIDIDTSGVINIGANASVINLAGGAGGGVSRFTHKHNYAHLHKGGNMGIPIPPQDHIGLTIETDVTTDNTTITKVD